MARQNSTQLPSERDMRDILAKEAQRAIPPENQDRRFVSFEPLFTLCKLLSINTAPFEESVLDDGTPTDNAPIFVESCVAAILGLPAAKSSDQLTALNGLYDYLAEEDSLSPSDLIFVFGSKTPARIEKAIEIYRQGLGKKLVLSGKSPHYAETHNGLSEAETYRDLARAADIPETDIILETDSITIPDNVRRSLNLLDELHEEFSSIILVNSPYVQRRGYAVFQKYLPSHITILRANSDTQEKFSRDGWYTNEDGIKIIINEYIKLKIAVAFNTV